jgi:hypothetical protein
MPTLRDAPCVSLSVAFTVLLTLSTLVHTMTRLTDALAARFTDADEIQDVAKYGCSGGVSGFIYYKEIRDFFNEHEDDIENTIADLGLDIRDLVDVNTDSVMELINKMVWLVVENYCQEQADL